MLAISTLYQLQQGVSQSQVPGRTFRWRPCFLIPVSRRGATGGWSPWEAPPPPIPSSPAPPCLIHAESAMPMGLAFRLAAPSGPRLSLPAHLPPLFTKGNHRTNGDDGGWFPFVVAHCPSSSAPTAGTSPDQRSRWGFFSLVVAHCPPSSASTGWPEAMERMPSHVPLRGN